MTSTEWYRRNPEGRRRKARTDKAINARPEQRRKRSEANQARRRARARGQNVTGKDYDHAVNRMVSVKTNRGRRGEGGRK